MSTSGYLPRITVIGTGYLGLTHAVCMADLGHQVLAIDVDEEKIVKAAAGEAPFFEPGLEPLLRKNLDGGRLRFTTSFAEIGEFGDVHFLCVGTPEGESNQADLSYVHAATDALAPHLVLAVPYRRQVDRPGWHGAAVDEPVRAAAPAGDLVGLAWNPEFLREGFAVQDSLTPDRMVFGVTSEQAEAMLRQGLRHAAGGRNPLASDGPGDGRARQAGRQRVSRHQDLVHQRDGRDMRGGGRGRRPARRGARARRPDRAAVPVPGLGFGGGCLPKDIHAFRATASTLGISSLVNLLSAVDDINLGRRDRVTALAREAVGGNLNGKRVAVLGVAFKPNSDDVRDSPSLDVCARLAAEGAIVSAHDPVAMPNAVRKQPSLQCAESVSEAAEGATWSCT